MNSKFVVQLSALEKSLELSQQVVVVNENFGAVS